MAGKVLASRSPWDRRTKAMTSLWPSPASPLNGDCHGLDVSIQTESDKNKLKLSHGTVGMVDNLEINKMVHVNCWK